MRVAVVGAGIAGMSAAWALHREHEITVYEKEPRPGGHSHTVDVDYDGTTIPVDTGFIVYNELNYPNLTALFATLGVETIPTNMTFGFSSLDGRLEWQGNTISSLFAQRSNLFSLSFHRMWLDILRFRRNGLTDLNAGRTRGHSLGSYLKANAYGDAFRDHCIVPMGAAIWSTSATEMLSFPAESFIRFFENHRLFYFDKPLWRTVKGGSREYVKRLTAPFADRIRLNTPVAQIKRTTAGVEITDTTGHRGSFDQVILACHSDEALPLLADATEAERQVLGPMRYASNRVYLHRDPSLMPKRKAVWSSWNYLARETDTGGAVSVSYWMNRLQSIDEAKPLFVSLN
ncbi:MAG: FAD-dependent oxidoreductase, partial [Alphaproteobacteria bacterium]|nr:FAD-dependent oxidoreductase [Alphaproteobacteria bacterium]